MDIKVVSCVISFLALCVSWAVYKLQRDSKPPEIARAESWSKLTQEAGIDIGKIDNDEYLESLSKAQKNLVDNYNVFVHGASLENILKDIGISDGKVLNKLISMSRSQKHTKAPGFGYCVNLYDFFTLIIWFIIILGIPWFMLRSIEESLAWEDLGYIFLYNSISFIVSLILLLIFYIVRLFVKDKITKSLIINNVYYYLHDFYGIGDDVKDSRGDYEDRMKIKSRAFLLYGTGKMYDQVKSNIYMVGIGEGLEGYKPVLEEDMKPQDYGTYKDPLLISWYIKIVEKVFKK
ncbi:hypothetical protein [Rothia dentocariosa]